MLGKIIAAEIKRLEKEEKGEYAKEGCRCPACELDKLTAKIEAQPWWSDMQCNVCAEATRQVTSHILALRGLLIAHRELQETAPEDAALGEALITGMLTGVSEMVDSITSILDVVHDVDDEMVRITATGSQDLN